MKIKFFKPFVIRIILFALLFKVSICLCYITNYANILHLHQLIFLRIGKSCKIKSTGNKKTFLNIYYTYVLYIDYRTLI